MQDRSDPPKPPHSSLKGCRSIDVPLALRLEDAHPQTEPEGPDSTTPSHVSLRGDRSCDVPLAFRKQDVRLQTEPERPDSPTPSAVSLKSNQSCDVPIWFRKHNKMSPTEPEGPDSTTPSHVSLRGDRSCDVPLAFRKQDVRLQTEPERPDSPTPSAVSLKSNQSCDVPIWFRKHNKMSPALQQMPDDATDNQTDLLPLFMLLQENIVTFVKNELKKFQRILTLCYPEGGRYEEEEVVDGEEEEPSSSRDAFLKITLEFLRRMKQDNLADSLQNRTLGAVCQRRLKSNLKKKFQSLFQGISKSGNPTLLNQIFTEIHITEGESGEVNLEHEVRQIESKTLKRPERTIKCENIFKPIPEREPPIRTVMTKGVAGIGNTVLTRKFTLDWAEGKANQDIQFTFLFTFRQLNVLKEKKYSLVELVHRFFPETNEAGISRFEEFSVAFIFDGLDECRLPLDFHNSDILTDCTEPASVAMLLTNLISGNLLPSARLWITTRPAAANQIPAEFVDVVAEVRGFTDLQKEEYFKKTFRNEEQANRIISHIKSSRSIHIMCHLPIFCWISAKVLEKTSKRGELPTTLTEMYIHFLVVQSKLKNIKYDGGRETDPHWNAGTRKMIQSLGRLAFEQLEKGNLIFYESDLRDCGINIKEASIYSGVFTQIFREDKGPYQDKVFCFIHLSFQEFMAALYVHMIFFNTGVNLLSDIERTTPWSKLLLRIPEVFYHKAIKKALKGPSGHLELFLRFLMGLSLPTSQSLLQGLVTESRNISLTSKLIQYIKQKIKEDLPPERSINLFHCLNELKDHSLMEDIQQYLRSGHLDAHKLSPAQWSALVFILLSSEKELDVFDLKKYSDSEEALLRMLPVIKVSTKAQLSCCNLSEISCEALSTVLSSKSCMLRELDLSNNDLGDSGVNLLCAGLKSPHCALEVLRLSGCQITDKGYDTLASAMNSTPFHLIELDLSYNASGPVGSSLLCDALKRSRLKSVRMGNCGLQTLKPGLTKYACKLKLDQNTANNHLILSNGSRSATVSKRKQVYPPHPERFDHWIQVLCTDGLTGRCYWEVECEGDVDIGVAYKEICRRGDGNDSCLGGNDQSWVLSCPYAGDNSVHSERPGSIDIPRTYRVGVFLDWPAGTLSFYRLSSDKKTHLKTIKSTFTKPLYPAFRIRKMTLTSSVSLGPG